MKKRWYKNVTSFENKLVKGGSGNMMPLGESHREATERNSRGGDEGSRL